MSEMPHEKLARLCAEAGLTVIADNARNFIYHDFKSPLPFPDLTLDAHLAEAIANCKDEEIKNKIIEIRAMHQEGEFDATREESEEWIKTPEGQAAVAALEGK